MFRLLLAAIASFVVSGSAHATYVPLEALNRVHGGMALHQGTSAGFIVGFDSRMTRLIMVDMGGFGSPVAMPEEMELPEDSEPESYVFLRHGLYVAPGIRIPHRQGPHFSWDAMVRVGAAAIWSADVHPENRFTSDTRYRVESDPALLGGLDLQLRKKRVGLRFTHKQYVFQPYSQDARADLMLYRQQWTIEGLYQW
ncbi:MAG: hypothetical protein QGG40_22105 [Myxococcota bacterium]|nr:hypothetical protein [Myxococcota bacterium]